MPEDAGPALAIIVRCGRGELTAGMALTQLLLLCRDVAATREILARALGGNRADPLAAQGAGQLLRLLERQREGVEGAMALLSSVPDDPGPAGSPEEGLERVRRLFDRAAETNPLAGVALYSLGDPELLARATEETARYLTRLGIAAPGRHLLDIGCGIGRFERALFGHVASITGIDVSAGMVAQARERCAGLANVRLLQTNGRDLAAFAERSFDAVLGLDTCPYLYQAGGPGLVLAWLREVDRVLRPGGDVLLINLSYRGDLDQDRNDATGFAAALGFELLRNGVAELRAWDGRTFHLRKPAEGLRRRAQAGRSTAPQAYL